MFWRYYDESIIKYIIWHFVFTSCIKDFFFWFLGVYLLTLKTEYLIFPESNCIILNCTYHNGNYERIRDTYIRWQKLIDGEFKDIAVFSPPGGLAPFIMKEMQDLYSNRTLLIAPNTSLSAVMIIKEPRCGDKGVYQCWVTYFYRSYSLTGILSRRSIVKFKGNFCMFYNVYLIFRVDTGIPFFSVLIYDFFPFKD